MSLALNFPPVAPHIVLSTVKPLSVVRDPTNNNRYLTLAVSDEEEWDDGTDREDTEGQDPVSAVFLSSASRYTPESHNPGEVVELDRNMKVILEPAELKILEEDAMLSTAGVTANEAALIKAGQKIQAIKAIRERTGHGLKDAKDIADNAQSFLGV